MAAVSPLSNSASLPLATLLAAVAIGLALCGNAPEAGCDVAYSVQMPQAWPELDTDLVGHVISGEAEASKLAYSVDPACGDTPAQVRVWYSGDDRSAAQTARRAAYRLAHATRPKERDPSTSASDRRYAAELRLADLQHTKAKVTAKDAAEKMRLLVELELLSNGNPALMEARPQVTEVRNLRRASTFWTKAALAAALLVLGAAAVCRFIQAHRLQRLETAHEARESLALPARVVPVSMRDAA